MVYNVNEYAGQYAERDLLDRTALEKTGFEVDARLCTRRCMEALDCVAAAHMLLPRLEKELPDLYDGGNGNTDAIRAACSDAAMDVACLLHGDGSQPDPSDVSLMVGYVKAFRRVRLNWARMDGPEFTDLRDAIDSAVERTGIGAIGSVRNDVIRLLPSLEVTASPDDLAVRQAVAKVCRDRKKGGAS